MCSLGYVCIKKKNIYSTKDNKMIIDKYKNVK